MSLGISVVEKDERLRDAGQRGYLFNFALCAAFCFYCHGCLEQAGGVYFLLFVAFLSSLISKRAGHGLIFFFHESASCCTQSCSAW